MLSGEGNAGDRRKTTIGLNSQKKQQQQLSTCSTFFFFFISLPLSCTTTTQNFQKPFFYGGNVVRVIVHFFSLPLIFTLHWWPLAFLILSSLLQNFHIGFQQKMSPFFISRSRSLSPFFSLSFAGLSPNLSFSLSFSCSMFQICGHDH